MATVAPTLPATDVASALLAYFRQRLQVEDLDFAREPVSIPNGWEAHVYHFQLHSGEPLPEEFTRPLVVRGYGSRRALARMRHEADIQRHVGSHGYPVARPLLVEESEELFGGPFMVMERVAGDNLFDIMMHHWYTIWWAPARMAETHARLHQLPPDPAAPPAGPFWSRSLASLEACMQQHALYGLAPGLDWLDAHTPEPPEAESIIHLDFHPINLMFDGRQCNAVLDWSESDVGDRHADIATTVVLIRSAPVELPRIRHKIAAAVGKRLLEHWYLQTYRKYLPIDDDRLHTYMAWAALRRLCAWGRWLHAGPLITGGKPSSVRHLRPDRIDFLCRLFQKLTGTPIKLP